MISHKKYQNYLLSLLIISGSLKVFLTYYNFPFDITIIILSLIVFDILYTLNKRKTRLTKTELFYVLNISVFYLIAIVSLIYTPIFYLGLQKFLLMLIPITGFFYVKVIKELNLKVLYNVLIYIIIPFSLWFILFKYLLWHDSNFLGFNIDVTRFNPLRNSYLSFGYQIGLLTILSFKYSRYPFFITILSLSIILILGSRGALLFLILSLFIVYFKQILFYTKNFKIKKRILNFLFFSIIPILGLIVLYQEKIKKLLEYGLIRFTSLIHASSDESLLGRFDQYSYIIGEALSLQGVSIGFGLGSFGINYSGINELTYPHNIFLEAWYEMGFFAMCVLMAFFILPFFHLKRKQILLALALFAFFNAMKTLSFSTDRCLFILFGILIFNKEFVSNNYLNRIK